MILKPPSKPHDIDVLEIIPERIHPNHKVMPLVLEEFAIRQAGYIGEKSLEYYLDPLPHKDFHILYDIRLKNEKYHFQIDTLLLSRFLAINLEAKNFAGDLYFDDLSKQFFRINDGHEDGFKNPIAQAERQQSELQTWFHNNNIKIPVEYLVGIKNPSSKIKVSPGGEYILEKVMHYDHLIKAIIQLQNKHPKPVLTQNQLNSISKKILQAHNPLTIDYMKKFEIKQSDLITGVKCPSCSSYRMARKPRMWYCPKCHAVSKVAHKKAIEDFLLLFNGTISNRQCREFLHIKDRNVATRLLNSMSLERSGAGRGIVYFR